MKTIIRCFALTALLSVPCLSRADEVSENLDTAKEAYESGRYSEAIQSLDYAGTLIRQKKSEAVGKLLPEAPSDWTAEDVENESAAAGMMGGIVGAKRTYRRSSGDGRVTIQIQSDSPMLQAYAMMFSNPMMIASSGAKVETIKGQKCAVTFKNKESNCDVKSIVDNRYIVTVEGDSITREELLSFAKSLDLKALSAMK